MKKAFAVSVLSGLLLTACGGGGGGGNSNAPAPAPMNPPATSDSQNQVTPSEPVAPEAPAVPQAPSVPQLPAEPVQPEPVQPAPVEPVPSASQPVEPAPQPDEPAAPNTPQLSVRNDLQGIYPPVLEVVIADDQKVKLELLPVDETRMQRNIISQEVETLQDSNGKAAAYYGYAVVNKVEKEAWEQEFNRDNIETYVMHDALGEKQQPSASSGAIEYNGKMFYYYHDQPTDMQQARVQANYSAAEKTLSMNIFADNDAGNQQWYLYDSAQGHTRSDRVAVEQGSVSGLLALNDTQGKTLAQAGQFTGGFYGENGQFLLGSAQNEREAAGEKWQGVIGAQAVEKSE